MKFFLKAKGAKKEAIKDPKKQEILYTGVQRALLSLGAIEKETITVYPEGIRKENVRFLPKSEMPKGFSFAWTAAEAWALGKHTSKEIAAYIENEFKEHIKPTNK